MLQQLKLGFSVIGKPTIHVAAANVFTSAHIPIKTKIY